MDGAGEIWRGADFQRGEFVGDDPGSRAAGSHDGATVTAWVYPTARGGYRPAVTKETPGGAAYYLYSAPGDVAMGGGGFAGGNYHEIGGGAVLPLNTRAHLATTYDAARDRGYRR